MNDLLSLEHAPFLPPLKSVQVLGGCERDAQKDSFSIMGCCYYHVTGHRTLRLVS